MRTLIALLLAAGPALADITGPGGRVIECYCTGSDGERVELGQRACLTINGRAILALCDMSLNNPTWRYTAEGCFSAQAGPLWSPVPTG